MAHEATIYRRGAGDTYYYSSNEVQPPKQDLEKLKDLSRLFSPEQYEEALRKLHDEHENGEVQEDSVDRLASVSKRYDFLAPMARETRNAQIDMAVTLMNQTPSPLTEEDEAATGSKKYADALDKHLTLIKKATGEGWPKLRAWADEPPAPGAGNKKTGAVRVPSTVVRALDAKVDEAQEAAAKRRATAKANKDAAQN